MKGKVLIVTGGAGYIGGTIAAKAATMGAIPVIFDIDAGRAEAKAAEIGGKGYALNLTDYAQVEKAVADVKKEFGRIDFLVSCAGGSARSRMAAFANQSLEVIHDVIDMNMYGMLHSCRAVIPYMIEQNAGSIVNIASVIGLQGLRNAVEYGASKGAILAATKGLALELGQYNIRVNAVSPGKVQRPDSLPADPEAFAHRYCCLNRICTADDIAEMVCFLLSDKAGFITGQNYIVDGGRSLGLKGEDWPK